MNKDRRKALAAQRRELREIIGQIEGLRDEEQEESEYFESIDNIIIALTVAALMLTNVIDASKGRLT